SALVWYFLRFISLFFSFDYAASSYLYTLSLHDALPIFWLLTLPKSCCNVFNTVVSLVDWLIKSLMLSYAASSVLSGADNRIIPPDRKSTRLNSSHVKISYAVFCLKKKNK